MYKPGQLITINNVVYRIKYSPYGCISCDYLKIDPLEFPCRKCPKVEATKFAIALVKLCKKSSR